MTKLNNEQWGNIELPGLTDEELLNTDWHRKTIMKELVQTRVHNSWYEKNTAKNIKQSKDPNYISKQLAGVQDSTYKQRKSIQMLEVCQTEEWKKSYQAGREKALADPEFGKKVSEGLKLALNTPEAKAKKKEVAAKNYQNPDYVSNRKKGLILARAKFIVTPIGVFPTIKDAGLEYNKIKKFNNGAKWVKAQLTKDPKQFYLITYEEYIILTGKEL